MITLEPYTGEWTREHASFLISRCTFSRSADIIEKATELGLTELVEIFFQERPLPNPPIHYRFENDPAGGIGETWVNQFVPYNSVQGLKNHRNKSLRAWMIGLMMESGLSIREKMVLFWHEHFAISNLNNPEFGYHYLTILRRNALGNFKSLTEEMTICPAMLRFLNGDQNTAASPNENYARELLELFTIGRGEAAGEGDYTHYTEQDVVELARSLTGWKTKIYDNGVVSGIFKANKHDAGIKQLSHRFDNQTISNGGQFEYKQVINIIFQKIEVAKHISRKLHIWFVGSNIDEEVEANIIEPMAQLIFENKFEIASALKALLKSIYFNSGNHKACMLSSPLDWFFKAFSVFKIKMSNDIIKKYFIWEKIWQSAKAQEMDLLNVDSVAGWKAYYQEPNYYKFWINSVTLTKREVVARQLINGFGIQNKKVKIDTLNYIAGMENNMEVNELIHGLAKSVFEVPIGDNQIVYLKEILIPGLPDFEWTVEYSRYLADPEDENLKKGIEGKLKSLILSLIKMAEYQLM